VIWLWGLGLALASVTRRAASPGFSGQARFSAQAQRFCRSLPTITGAGTKRAADRGIRAVRHLTRRPDLPLYAAAVLAAVLVGWIVGRTI
jgi:hypothetical protein